ncbi:MAG: TIGR03936 family radical SAM-associated protein [Clostridiales bacterium]|nr:TIGR03936 family radical SAM-associated protein [Clostridiales bacterium]
MFNSRMRFSKTGNAKFVSHLDTMRLFQRTFQRAKLPLWYTEGFNPHPYVSILLPLSTGFAGLDEIIDFDLHSDSLPEHALEMINQALPSGFHAHTIGCALTKPKEIAYAEYEIELYADDVPKQKLLSQIHALFERDSILTKKKSKSGEIEVDIKDFMVGVKAYLKDGEIKINTVLSAGNQNLNPEYLVKVIHKELSLNSCPDALFTRKSILNEHLEIFR